MSARHRTAKKAAGKRIVINVPQESATKRFLIAIGQQMVPLVIIAGIGVATTAHNTAEQVTDLRKSVSDQVGQIRSNLDRSDTDRRAALAQYEDQAKELAKLSASMSFYLQNQDTVNKEIRERLTFIERNQNERKQSR